MEKNIDALSSPSYATAVGLLMEGLENHAREEKQEEGQQQQQQQQQQVDGTDTQFPQVHVGGVSFETTEDGLRMYFEKLFNKKPWILIVVTKFNRE